MSHKPGRCAVCGGPRPACKQRCPDCARLVKCEACGDYFEERLVLCRACQALVTVVSTQARSRAVARAIARRIPVLAGRAALELPLFEGTP